MSKEKYTTIRLTQKTKNLLSDYPFTIKNDSYDKIIQRMCKLQEDLSKGNIDLSDRKNMNKEWENRLIMEEKNG